MNKVFFHNADAKSNLKAASTVKANIEVLFSKEKKHFQRVDYIFCSDDYLLKINKQFLNHDTYTDIITFTLSKPVEPIVGEIYISVERIKENAKSYKSSYQNELLRVIIHGALHLCGWTDESKKKKQVMHGREDFYLNLFNVPRESNS